MPDIIAVIGATVTLKRRGSVYFGTCPFHKENTGSFCVYPVPRRAKKPFFKCFGCDAHGDVVDFIQKLKNCSYREACAFLGTDAAYAPDPSVVAARKEAVRQERAWHEFLDRHPESPEWVREYLSL